MQVLGLLRSQPTTARDKLAPLIKPEAEQVWALHLAGSPRSIHFLQAPGAPYPMGVSILMEADIEGHAKALIDTLPMVAEGLTAAEILPLAPFTGYAALFANAPARG